MANRNSIAGIDYRLKHAIDVAVGTYNVPVSIDQKKKNLLKFGTHTAVGTGWETLTEMQDNETEETFITGNDIL